MTPKKAAAVHASAFAPQRGWTETEIATLLDHPTVKLFSKDGAFALVRTVADEAELLTIAVPPAQQGKGTGQALMRVWMQEVAAATAFLEVAADNRAAHALYLRLGFCEIARRPAYYSRADAQAVDALIMRANLTSGQHRRTDAHPLKTG
ncbi:MAG: GNAT family N-acetyltransferase [Roseobacter sp.]